eukprot:TRINITY_DN27810_c0_g1_i1.p1 TRINITY_DN27810_c0_g1~~TRINITY_DN27810_c0_g1_i1.p1  ORF type:complete len:180 (-),score=35.46 TRINITY_DN27810_c0_g1_i1:68-607(-)
MITSVREFLSEICQPDLRCMVLEMVDSGAVLNEVTHPELFRLGEADPGVKLVRACGTPSALGYGAKLTSHVIQVVNNSPRRSHSGVGEVTGFSLPGVYVFGLVLKPYAFMLPLLIGKHKNSEEHCQLARLPEHVLQLMTMMMVVEIECVGLGPQAAYRALGIEPPAELPDTQLDWDSWR